MAARKTNATDSTSAPLGYEAELWRMADALRGSMDAAEYKHVVAQLKAQARQSTIGQQTVLEQAALLSGEWATARM